MKLPILTTCFLVALASAAVHAENLVINGDFESGEGNAFYQTTGWYNCGTGLDQGTNARSETGAIIEGSYSAIVIDRYNSIENKFGPLAHTQKTKYVIKEGDSFALTYDWRPGNEWWNKRTDTIRFVLYATVDDKLGSPVVWSAEMTSGFFRGDIASVMSVSEVTEAVNPDAVGRLLFVTFHGLDTVDGLEGSPHWARVDNIEVVANNSKSAP